MGEPGHDSASRELWIRVSDHSRKNRTAGTGQRGRTAGTGQPEQYRRDKTGRTGQESWHGKARKDRQNSTVRIKKNRAERPEHDSKDGRAQARQPWDGTTVADRMGYP
jgi:hypothetical protein